MTWLGDFDLGSTVFFKFTTVTSSGAPSALSSAAVTAYRDGSTVQDTTGITLTSTFDVVAGLNHVQIDMSTAGFYSSAGTYTAIISSGGTATADLAGYVLREWSLLDRAPLTSTAGLETLSSAGLETLSSAGLETASSNVSVANLSTAAAIEVNAEVVDALATDTYAEPGLGAPSTLASIALMIRTQYHALRSGLRVSASGKTFLTHAGGIAWVKGIGDDGSTYFEVNASTST